MTEIVTHASDAGTISRRISVQTTDFVVRQAKVPRQGSLYAGRTMSTPRSRRMHLCYVKVLMLCNGALASVGAVGFPREDSTLLSS